MDPNTEQYLDMAKVGLDTAHKTGLLGRIVDGILHRRERPTDWRVRALEAIRENALQTLANLELTTAQALQILRPTFSLEDLDSVDSTWQTHWTEGARKVGIDDEERRTWWARLLAGEVQQPGTFSLRTLAVMDTLSMRDAQLFTELCGCAWRIGVEEHLAFFQPNFPSKFRESFSRNSQRLQSSGLITHHGIIVMSSGKIEATPERPRQFFPVAYHRDVFHIMVEVGKPLELQYGMVTFTEEGEEIFRLVTPPYMRAYRDEVVKSWQKEHEVVCVLGEHPST